MFFQGGTEFDKLCYKSSKVVKRRVYLDEKSEILNWICIKKNKNPTSIKCTDIDDVKIGFTDRFKKFMQLK